jgi:hypothetical protein
MIKKIVAAFGVTAAIALSGIGVAGAATAATTAQASATSTPNQSGPPWG